MTNINENTYCCNGFCNKKDNCFRYKLAEYLSQFEETKCLYLHDDKDKCFLDIEKLEDNKITKQ